MKKLEEYVKGVVEPQKKSPSGITQIKNAKSKLPNLRGNVPKNTVRRPQGRGR